MFNLSDSRATRSRVVYGYAQMDPHLGVVLAAMDFEWVCRRAILVLSKVPTSRLYEQFRSGDYKGMCGVLKAWENEVSAHCGQTFNGVFEKWAVEHLKDASPVTMSQICDAMGCRNVVVHGTGSRVDNRECRCATYILERACNVMEQYLKVKSADIYRPINRRRREKEIESISMGGKRIMDWQNRMKSYISSLPENHWVRSGKIVE